jgi:NADPH-dependent curcumin reductase CurA
MTALPANLQNTQWIYRSAPTGAVGPENYELVHAEIPTELSTDEVLLEAKFISVDPYMRINQAQNPTWMDPHPLNSVQGAGVVAKILKSASPLFPVGRFVLAFSGWQRYARVHTSQLSLLPDDEDPNQFSQYLGVLGMPGRTAWFGLMEAGLPKPADLVVVSGASGAVGHLVVQIAKQSGAQVIAIAGRADKCQQLTEILGADASLNYRDYDSAAAMAVALKALMQKLGKTGVDVYFDNVGGSTSDAVLSLLNKRARIVICGQMSQYNGGLDQPEMGPRFLHHVLYQRATIQGILARDFAHRIDEQHAALRPLLAQGKLRAMEHRVHGFEQLPQALQALFGSQPMGKTVVSV